MPEEMYKVFGPISLGIIWLAFIFLLYKWRGDKSMSISKHAASHRSAYMFLLCIELIATPMFFLFFYKWFVPALGLPQIFTIIISISLLGYLLAGFIPDTDGIKGKIHALAAYGASILLIPALVIIYLSPLVSVFSKSLALFVLFFEMAAVTSFAVLESSRKYHLYVQILYFFLFDLTVIAVAYIR